MTLTDDVQLPYDIKNIAIIGAGPSGVATAKYLRAEHTFDNIDIFEQRTTVGGVWNYTPETSPGRSAVPQTHPDGPLERPVWTGNETQKKPCFFSPMYEQLETNIPHPMMQFSDLSFPEGSQLFPHHEAVMKYLERHAEEVYDLIHFATQVVDVQQEKNQRWLVRTEDLFSHEQTNHVYDAVVVASGHFNVPFIPDLENISVWNKSYPGTIIHSKFYRTPDQFIDKKVLVIGNSASGSDIGAQVGRVCRSPLLVSQRSESEHSPGLGSYKIELPEIKRFLVQDRAIEFIDGRLERDIDAVIVCTGYFYSYPFLSSLQPPPITDGTRTQHVFKHIFYNHHPTLAFVAVPQKILPFPISEAQAAVISRVWANRLHLPSEKEMDSWEGELVKEQGGGKAFHVLKFPRDVDYVNDLYHWAMQAEPSDLGRVPPFWGPKGRWIRERIPAMKRAFADRGEERHQILRMEDLGFEYDDP
ncbi:MAG: monooxygenase [Sclerophora amabilis]|nr:MAG: monooxygenase [Sclerophora amabilis]